MAKHLFQIICTGSQILGRSFVKAVKEEIVLSQEAAKYIKQQSDMNKQLINSGNMSINEAKQILDTREFVQSEIEERYKFLFNANSDKNGGNLYIRSKIVRAKEKADEELKK